MMFASLPLLRRHSRLQQVGESRGIARYERLIVVAMSLAAGLWMVTASFNPLQAIVPQPPQFAIGWNGVLQVTVWIVQAITLIRVIAVGASVSAEIHGTQGDLMTLAGQQSLVVSITYWWATLRRVRGWVTALGLIQLMSLLTWMIALLFQGYIYETYNVQVSCHRYNFQCALVNHLNLHTWHFWTVVFSEGCAIGLTFLQVASAAALGVAAGVCLRSTGLAITLALAIRALPVVIFTWLPDYPQAHGSIFVRWIEYTSFALAASGMTALLRLASPVDHGTFERGIFALCAAVFLLGLYLIGSLTVSQIALHRRGLI